jgi:hypothetical protein
MRRDPTEHYVAIGQAVAVWADFDLTVEGGLWKVLGVPQAVGACVTSQFSSVFARLQALQSLAHLHQASEADLRGLGRFKGDLSSLSERRSRIVHDARFRRQSGEVGRWEMLARRELQFGTQTETVESLRQLRDEVAAKRREFLAPSRRIPRRTEALRSRSHKLLPRLFMSDLDEADQPGGQ